MNSWSSGCMSAIFRVFDIQHHQSFRFHHPSFISESTININSPQSTFSLQGVEAPRNSLETPESAMENIAPSSSSSKVKEQKNLNIQMGGIKIKTQRSRFTDDISSECSSSPGTKTPGLVARLMGLDLLPEYSSPRPSSSSTTPVNSHHRSSSLPTTPRMSTASRRSTDNEYHHRLSLQVDKENDMKMTRRKSEEYAKQIANQVRERINRRLGTDITNTVSTTKNKEQRRDSNLVLLKPKKVVARTPASALASVTTTKVKNDENTTFLRSPKFRLLDINNNLNKPMSNSQSSPQVKVEKPLKEKKIKRIPSERYDLRLKKMSQQDDAIVMRKNCKKKSTTLQHHVVNVKNTTKFLSFKKEVTSSSSTTRLPQKQVSFLGSMKHLPSNPNLSYNNVVTTTTTFLDHFDYISRIIDQCGIYHTTLISYGQWHTPSHPLHPSIFHTLEKQYHHTNTTKRKLIFDLVDELLSEILRPYMNCVGPYLPQAICTMCGNELIKKVCDKIDSFGPGAKCDTLEDIDGLIERDMGTGLRRLLMTAVEAEIGEIVTEIVEMMVVEMVEPAKTDKMRSHVMFT
uniref:uncharacterized protein LOC122589847 n=1 Tax=Erigeron canadensis TaxID=72917 RepID=UPI001CB9B341|nr:uncharacterized protein LOC122589847 [Erigeron canadensis]